MKRFFLALFSLVFTFNYSQTKKLVKKSPVKTVVSKPSTKNLDLVKINDSVPALIPFKKDGKYGFRNQKGKVVIQPEYTNVGFFTVDCNLQNSKSVKVKKFGNAEYASVRAADGKDYRIDFNGKKVYTFKDEDLGKCGTSYKTQIYHAYKLGNYYGIIEDSKFENPGDYRQYSIYPQYDYLHIMEGKDVRHPMILAIKDNKFGIVDIQNHIVIPFEYQDIKPNFSWFLAHLFEVSKDGKNYFFVDEKNKAY